MTSPREGLPCQCFKGVARFEGRVAWWYVLDSRCSECKSQPAQSLRHHIMGGKAFNDVDGAPACSVTDCLPWTRTDDPDEAKAAFERGREYVRTGVLA